MKTLAFLLVCGYLAAAPKAQPTAYVTSDPSGACTVGVSMQYNSANGRLWGCEAGTWALVASGSSGGSVFGGSTATASAGITGTAAAPIFSLADQTLKSPVRFEPLTLSADVTSVTFTNKTAGAKFSIVWAQDGSGNHVVNYGASATNTCTIDPTAGVKTTQQFEVSADGTTVNGISCSTTGTLSIVGGALAVTSLQTTGSAGSKKVVCVDTTTGVIYASSTGTDCSN